MPDATQTTYPWTDPRDNLPYPANIRINGLWAHAEACPSIETSMVGSRTMVGVIVELRSYTGEIERSPEVTKDIDNILIYY